MKTIALILCLIPSASFGQCYRGACYVPTYAAPAPVVYKPPVNTYNSTYTYNYPPPIVIPVGIPVNYQQPLARLNYTYSSAQPYIPLDSNLFVREGSAYLQLAQNSAAKGFDTMSAVVEQIKENDASVAQFAEVAKAFAVAKGTVGDRITTTTRTQINGGSVGGVPPVPFNSAVTPTSKAALFQAKCISCHAGFPKWEDMTGDMQLTVRKRIRSHNPAFRMPQGVGATKDRPVAGVPLTDLEMELFDE